MDSLLFAYLLGAAITAVLYAFEFKDDLKIAQKDHPNVDAPALIALELMIIIVWPIAAALAIAYKLKKK